MKHQSRTGKSTRLRSGRRRRVGLDREMKGADHLYPRVSKITCQLIPSACLAAT